MTDEVITGLIGLWQANPIVVTAAAAITATLLGWGVFTLVSKAVRAVQARNSTDSAASGAGLFYLTAAMSTAVSANTSWRYFGHQLNITNTVERIAMFAVLEVALIACAYAMRANVRHYGQPGAPHMVAWTLTIVAAYMAVAESGFWAGIARVALGPALGIVMLHLALGIELRRGNVDANGTLVKVFRELRERALSRLGLGDDSRDALARTQERAARRAARLAIDTKARNKQVRLQRALRAANVAHDPAARQRMLDELAMLRHADQLVDLEQESPWATDRVTASVTAPGEHDDSAFVTRYDTGVTPQANTAPGTERVTATADVFESSTVTPAEQVSDLLAQVKADTVTPDETVFATRHTGDVTPETDNVAAGDFDTNSAVTPDLVDMAPAEQTQMLPAVDRDTTQDELNAMNSNAERVRYAVTVLGHMRPSEIVTWLAGYGHTVTQSNARVVINRFRDKNEIPNTVVRLDGRRAT